MKKMVTTKAGVFMGCLLACCVAAGQSAAQTPPGIKVSVAVDRPAYLLQTNTSPGDPIKIAVTLENISGGTVLASHGLVEEPLALLLVFTDPDGQLITATQRSLPHEGGPPPVLPVDGVLVQVDPLDVLASTFVQSVTIPDARTFYPFTKAGFYTVKATVPIRTYPAIFRTVGGVDYAQLETANFGGSIDSAAAKFALVVDADHDNYSYPVALTPYNTTAADCNDANPAVHPGATEIPNNGIDDDCNPATPDVVVVAPATINVTAEKHIRGPAPGIDRRSPFANLPVHVFETASSCVARFGTGAKYFRSVWVSCSPKYVVVTDTSGTAKVPVAPGSYLVLGEYDPNGTPNSGDELYDGATTGTLASGGTVQELLKIFINSK